MDLRLLTADDAEAFWHLRLQALRDDPASFADSAEEHQASTIASFKERLFACDSALNFVVGYFEGGALAGTAGFYRHLNIKERHKGHIWGVYVRPESRGKGAARALMQEIIRRARGIEGLEQILLVATAHLPARKLYEAIGFAAYGVEPRSLKLFREETAEKTTVEYIDDVLMVLFLNDFRKPE